MKRQADGVVLAELFQRLQEGEYHVLVKRLLVKGQDLKVHFHSHGLSKAH
jgi:hypothetical protein